MRIRKIEYMAAQIERKTGRSENCQRTTPAVWCVYVIFVLFHCERDILRANSTV